MEYTECCPGVRVVNSAAERYWMRILILVVLSLPVLCFSSGAQDSRGLIPIGAGDSKGITDWDFDGNRILGHVGNDLYLWDAHTGRVLDKLVGHRDQIRSVQLSPDGRYAASSSWIRGVDYEVFPQNDLGVRIWDLRTGKQLWKLDGQVDGSFSPDGKRILTHSVYSKPSQDTWGVDLAMWDVASGHRLFDVKPGDWWDQVVLADSTIFAPDGRTFVAFGFNSGVYSRILYDAESGRVIANFEPLKAELTRGRPRVKSLHYLGSGSQLTLSTEKGFEIWDTATGKRTRQIPFTSGGFDDAGGGYGPHASWSPDGTMLVASDYLREGTQAHVRIWNVNTGDSIAMPQCPPVVGTWTAGFDGKHFLLVAGSYQTLGGQLKSLPKGEMWDVKSGNEQWEAKLPEGRIEFSPDRKTFLVLEDTQQFSQDERVHRFTVYDLDSGEAIRTVDISPLFVSR